MKYRKEDCCGCQACAEICPFHAIHMKRDKEGFWYPIIDETICTHCGQCERVCPVKNAGQKKETPIYLGVQAKDDAIRYSSSSGGMFSLLAQAVLQRQGVVYGAGYESHLEVRHRKVQNTEQLETIKRTKYVQSNMDGIYREIRKELRQNRWVLFCGTPCQAQALRLFLDGEDSQLILVDLICYGAASPGIWGSYVKYLEGKYKGELTDFSFRDKRNRDHGQTRSFQINGKEIVNPLYQDPYCRMYFGNYSIRPSCHHCKFCKVERNSDFTIGDFWGMEDVRPELEDGMGSSLVMIHTEKARRIWDNIQTDARWFICKKEDALQPRLKEPTAAARHRRLFMEAYQRLPFSLLVSFM